MNTLELAQVIRFHRDQAGLTQNELSQLAEVGKTTVFDIEKGKPTVQLQSILKVLSVLNVTLSWESPLKELYLRRETLDDHQQ